MTLTFLTPALPDDIDLLSRPVTYLIWGVKSLDGQKHDVEIYFDASAELTVNDPAQAGGVVTGDVRRLWSALKVGSKDQPVLAKKGDDLRIDWGYLYAAADAGRVQQAVVAPATAARAAFVQTGARRPRQWMRASRAPPTMTRPWPP